MAYNFLGLVNNVNEMLNEVPLTSSNFADATGFYAQAKNSVNWAISKINSRSFEWPFNHTTKTLVLTPDVSRYDYEADAKTVQYNTFRIQRDDSLTNLTTYLVPVDYEEYLEKFSDMEYQPDNYHNIPVSVWRTPELQFGISPPPDQAYTLLYEYYTLPIKLTEWDDVPSVPENFEYVIFEGSMAKAFAFRGDTDQVQLFDKSFDDMIKEMRTIYTNRTEYARATTVDRR
jgi:hypothetical protein